MEKLKVIISGGGTGGHVFPAISIADAIKKEFPDAEILFIGADNRLEMKKVPEAGYEIIGLPIRGLQRKFNLKFIGTFFRLVRSIRLSRIIIRRFKPDIVIGVGGYASAAVVYVAAKKGIPVLLQEQNSYPGITNKYLSKMADAVCVAYDDMDRFFPPEKVIFTGNPVRNLKKTEQTKQEALEFFGLSSEKKTLFVTGGSLGAATLNKSIMHNFDEILKKDVQLIWQTGKRYIDEVRKFLQEKGNPQGIVALEFIKRMDLAYKAADLVISRAGAITISELALLGKAVIFVPSPNVAEDHQTKNAEALVKINAALFVKDSEAIEKLVPAALELIDKPEKINEMEKNILTYAKPDAAKEIVAVIKKILNLM